MRKICKQFLFLATIIIISIPLFSHIEPGKTKSERKEQEKERLRIKSQKIKTIRIYKTIIKNDSLTKDKFLYQIQDFDTNGNIVRITVYKAKDTLDMSVVYKYDQNNNMILDMDLDADEKMTEKIEYEYNKENLPIKGKSYNSLNKLEAIHEYITLKNDSLVRYIKKSMPADTVEYQIDYKYSDHSDSALMTAARKYLKEEQFLRIENKFNKRSQRTHKFVYDEKDNLNIKWLYYYDAAGNNTRISRLDSTGKFEYSFDRNFDGNGNIVKFRKINSNRKFADYQTFEFDYYK